MSTVEAEAETVMTPNPRVLKEMRWKTEEVAVDLILLSRGHMCPYETTEPPRTPTDGLESIGYVFHCVPVTKPEL